MDEDGNIIFTDRPTTNSEEIKLRELKTTETVKPSSSSSGSTSRGKNKEDFSYKKYLYQVLQMGLQLEVMMEM